MVRVFWERGCRVGRDVSVCAMNIERLARYCCPSITGLDMPDLSAVVAKCLSWFVSGDMWRGPLLLEPAKPVFFHSESSAMGCADP